MSTASDLNDLIEKICESGFDNIYNMLKSADLPSNVHKTIFARCEWAEEQLQQILDEVYSE